MKALVTGASGLLGRQFVRVLSRRMEVVALSHSQSGPGFRNVDLRDASALAGLLDDVQPDIVVHSAAYRDPDWCETRPEEARRLNVAPVERMARLLPVSSRLVFISSDYVFDGERPPYREEDRRDPVNVYGETKREAEDLALARPGSIILRIPLLVGDGPTWEDSGFVMKTAVLVREGRPVELDDQGQRFPTWTHDVAELVDWLLKGGHAGVFHFSGPQRGTRYTLALETAKLMGLPTDHIRRLDGILPTVAKRPPDSQLDTGKLRSMGYARFTPYREAASAIVRQFGRS